jgi:hypothetical protein
MLRLKREIGICILACALFPSIPVHAATYYVTTTGSNSNPGTSSKPWRNVAYAVGKMVAGDTTYVNGGVYSEGLVRFGTSGTQSAPIKLLNAPGQYPVIACKKDGKANMVLLSNKAGSTTPIGWITIEGFEIRDCYNGIKFSNLHNSTIRRNWIHHSWGGSGIFGWATRVVIDRNKINANTNSSSGGHGIYTNGSYYTITNNLIYDNGTFGVQLNGSGSSSYDPARHAGSAYAGSSNWTIANNTFAYQRAKSGIVVWGSTCNNALIQNNIFYENAVKSSTSSPQGITFASATCTGIVIRNNLAYASGSGGTKFLGTGGKYTQSGNTVNSLHPRFSNAPATLPSSPNFALTSGSGAINKGLSISSTKISYAGTSRPQLSYYDVGAYEYYGSSTTLAAPTSLQIVN